MARTEKRGGGKISLFSTSAIIILLAQNTANYYAELRRAYIRVLGRTLDIVLVIYINNLNCRAAVSNTSEYYSD